MKNAFLISSEANFLIHVVDCSIFYVREQHKHPVISNNLTAPPLYIPKYDL